MVNLTSFQFDLSFNSSILHVTETGISESPFFTQTDITVFNAGFVDNNAGSVLGVSDALIFQTPVNGSGIIANIEFNSIAVGTSPLTLSKVFLNLSDTGFSLSNGAVCVKLPTETGCRVDNAIPEPGTATLVAMGLVLLSSRRRMTLH